MVNLLPPVGVGCAKNGAMVTASWVPVPPGSDFPIENLPYGVFSTTEDPSSRLGVAIGDHVVDLRALAHTVAVPHPELFGATTLDPVLAAGRAAWSDMRERLVELLDSTSEPLPGDVMVLRDEIALHLPFRVGDFVDFYSSLDHATNVGRLFRPDSEPLLPNWRRLPIGYHGRAGSVVVSGTPVHRPCGQRVTPGTATPTYGPSDSVDFELELGFVTGGTVAMGDTLSMAQAPEHLFGVVLVNDWSARDIQAFEYQPLGPFLGKSFATTASPWVVTFDALTPFRVASPAQEPPPPPHLRPQGAWALDIELAVDLQVAGAPRATTLSRTNARTLYWTMPQQLVHAASNGAPVRSGDLFATGTISGREAGTHGSLLELTQDGRKPIVLPGGATRTFLADGDTVVLRAWCGGPGGRDHPRIGFGTCHGRIEPARMQG